MSTLKIMRDNLGFSQQEMARRVGVEENTYAAWETGKHKPYPRYRRALASTLGISVRELLVILFGDEGPSSDTIPIESPQRINGYIAQQLRLRLYEVVDAGMYIDQGRKFTLIIEEFDAMNTADLSYPVTRRQAIADLAALPFVAPLGLATRTDLLPASQYEPFLKECGASLVACEELSYSNYPEDRYLAFECVSRYIVELRAIAKSSSSQYRVQALELAARCAVQKALLSWHCVGNAKAVSIAQEAVDLALESGNICLLLSAESKLAWAYLLAQQKKLALRTATKACDSLKKYTGEPLPPCIWGGIHSTLSVMQARNQLPYERALKKAGERNPGNQVLYGMDFTTAQMFMERGQVFTYGRKTDEAVAAYAELVDLNTLEITTPFQQIWPQHYYVGILLDLSRASLVGPARDRDNAIRYWKAALEGARRLSHESVLDGAESVYEDMKLVFSGERAIDELNNF